MLIKKSTNKGLIRTILIIIIALLVLSYFGFNLRNLVDSPTTKDNFHTAITFIVDLWDNYLKKPVTYIWNEIFKNLIWDPAIQALKGNLTGAATK